MLGLAIGDSLSWPAMFHRSVLLPPWTRRIVHDMNTSQEEANVIAVPMPFSLNQPADLFDIAPTDDTEWAAFTAKMLLSVNPGKLKNTIYEEWMNLARSPGTIRGGVSTQAALRNLRTGIVPPQSGKENPHYFDDGAIPRSVPIGIFCVGQPKLAAEFALLDASVTNSEDGIWAAQAMAVAISLVCAGNDIDSAISEAVQFLPEDSWIRRTVDSTFSMLEGKNNVFSLLPDLHNKILNREYSYGNVAPETLAMTFVIAKFLGHDFERAVTTASSFAKSADSLPALVGAFAGALHTEPIAGDSWIRAVHTLRGICIPSLSGANYIEIIDQLVEHVTGRTDRTP